jgi:HD-GYP domain-containing protein (c-di-GMP phosphodiesterase class II)
MKKVECADIDRDIIFEEAFGTPEGLEFMNSIYRLLGHTMLLMGQNGAGISIPRESHMVLALPMLEKDHFSRTPMVFKGANGKNFIGIPIIYSGNVFAVLILDEVVYANQEVALKIKTVQNMLEWYIQVIHQRRIVCELQERTQKLGHEDLVKEHALAIESANKYRKISDMLKHAYLDTIYRLSITAEYKDRNTSDHIRRMSLYSKMLAEKMGLKSDEVEMMLCASPMHDIGKMGVPDAILLKQGPLAPDERGVMEQHPIFGANILGGSDSELLEYGKTIALTHHEKWDGTGYPQKLKGKNIPLAGRIAAVADVFDAMTSNRPYRPAWSFEYAMEKILKNSDHHFDPEIIDCFRSLIDKIRMVFDNHKDITPWSFGV